MPVTHHHGSPICTIGCKPAAFAMRTSARNLAQVERCSIEALTVVADLRPSWAPASVLIADGGTAAVSSDIVARPTVAALFDLPAISSSSNQPQIHLAATSAASDWKPVSFKVEVAGSSFAIPSAPRRSVLGASLNSLGPGEPFLLDLLETVDVELVDPSAWLTSCDHDALVAGVNLAVLGDEMIQFGSAEALGGGHFRLSRLLRGRRGTEWASGSHQPGEPFVLLLPGTLRPVELPLAAIGSQVRALPRGVADDDAAPVARLFSGEALRPPSPVHLRWTTDDGGALQLSWERRSREGFEWLDGIDAPLGERRELYRIRLQTSSASVERESSTRSLAVPASELAPLGPGPITMTVYQVGDQGTSRPATRQFMLP